MCKNQLKNGKFLKVFYVLPENVNAFAIFPYSEIEDAFAFIRFLANCDDCKSISIELLERFETKSFILPK